MSRQKNIFYKVAKDENSTTEIFCNLLGNKFFRDKFLEKFLDQKFISNIRYEEDINTQYCSTHGRPDLIIENETVKIIVEVKIDKYRGLTPKQPDGYLKELEESAQNNKWLIFLIPKGYVHFGEDDLEKIRSKYSHADIKIEIV